MTEFVDAEDDKSQIDRPSKEVTASCTSLDPDPVIKGYSGSAKKGNAPPPTKDKLLRESEQTILRGLGNKSNTLTRTINSNTNMLESQQTLDLTRYSQIP